METDPHGNPVPKYRTEVRTGWTAQNLYFLFVCPYEQLNLRPNPKTSTETYGLWNWDVAEVFIGADFKDVKRYKEFEISPQGEWTDLDIDLHKPHHEEGWTWNSGFQVSARIDRAARVWYGAVKIPYSAIDTRPQWPIPSTPRSALDCWNSPRKINAETRASEHTQSVSPHAVAYLCSTARM